MRGKLQSMKFGSYDTTNCILFACKLPSGTSTLLLFKFSEPAQACRFFGRPKGTSAEGILSEIELNVPALIRG
jgi:hypothetical protein